MDGWIKLHRKMRANTIFNDMHLFRLWIICLTEATHKERDQIVGKQSVHLMPGEFVTGRFDLHEMFNRGLKKKEQKPATTIWRWLEVLESSEYLVIKSNNKFSVISVSKWQDYQSVEQQNGQQMVNNLSTDGQQMVTNKNVKNDKKDKKESKIHYAELVTMTEKEYLTLVDLRGESFAKECIELLDNHKGAKGQTYKSDYRAIRTWVIDAVEEKIKKRAGIRPAFATVSEKEAQTQQRLAEQRKTAEVIHLKPEFDAVKEVAAAYDPESRSRGAL